MNTIKRFFRWILQWIILGTIMIFVGWVYITFISDDTTTTKTSVSKDAKLVEVEKTYWDNGNIKSVTTYKKSYKVGWKKVKTTLIPHGLSKDYYENGVLKKEDPYVDGNRTGVLKFYTEDGHLEISIEYLNNKKNGKTIYYDKDGTTLGIEYYKNGEQIEAPLSSVKSLKDLHEDMPYSEARKIILALGWKEHGSDLKDLMGQGKSLYLENGWKEVDSCAFSAGSPCRYEFIKNQKILVLFTMGECLNEEGEKCDLRMTKWFFE
jgi:hypothetical protein